MGTIEVLSYLVEINRISCRQDEYNKSLYSILILVNIILGSEDPKRKVTHSKDLLGLNRLNYRHSFIKGRMLIKSMSIKTTECFKTQSVRD